ncbi:DUF2238 domain-containing protein [Pseudomonas sp. RD9SR1]|uniref:DUF2238 domain-containing protein n=2 Tax=Pseudomonas oryzicola TaxID=485876 RepID=A0ABS6QAM1_9PSED|nr:DUF2238 domain-containing protein [Pseudomonas oryzicola]
MNEKLRLPASCAPSATPRQSAALLAVATVMVLASGVAPLDRADWLVENVLPVGLLLSLALTCRRWRFSPAAYLAIVVLLAIHELGAHFTYAKVPYDDWLEALTGHSLNTAMGWQRNQFDRLVHLSYGLLFVWPIKELLQRKAGLNGAWLALGTVSMVLATSALYELFEWVGGQYLGDDRARAFLATQKDPWDAQKDMALALSGAVVCLLIQQLAAFNRPGPAA